MVFEIDGKKAELILEQTPLGGISFQEEVLQAPFFGSMPTDDCSRSPHVLSLRLKRRKNALAGVVAAVAMNLSFWLPHWAELRRA